MRTLFHTQSLSNIQILVLQTLFPSSLLYFGHSGHNIGAHNSVSAFACASSPPCGTYIEVSALVQALPPPLTQLADTPECQ